MYCIYSKATRGFFLKFVALLCEVILKIMYEVPNRTEPCQMGSL